MKKSIYILALGGLVITRFGVQHVVWMSVGLLVVAMGMSFVRVGRKAGKVMEEVAAAA